MYLGSDMYLYLSRESSVVISRHGKANLRPERVGSVPKEKARAC